MLSNFLLCQPPWNREVAFRMLEKGMAEKHKSSWTPELCVASGAGTGVCYTYNCGQFH